jgi:hypothetical protein
VYKNRLLNYSFVIANRLIQDGAFELEMLYILSFFFPNPPSIWLVIMTTMQYFGGFRKRTWKTDFKGAIHCCFECCVYAVRCKKGIAVQWKCS